MAGRSRALQAHQMHFATRSPPLPVSSLSQLSHDASEILFSRPLLMMAPLPPPNHTFAPAGALQVEFDSRVLRRHGT